jgi:DNA-binding NarL/FixJ family response regulator
MIHVLIADDHAIVRRGLREIIAEQADMTVSGEAEDGAAVLRLLRNVTCDVVVLDLSLPDRSGLEVLGELKEQRPRLPVLVLSVHSEEEFAVRVLEAGAAGYLNKGCAAQELVGAVRKVHGGGRHVSGLLAERLARALAGGAEGLPHEGLSPREYQVLCLLGSGKRVTEVAEALSLSVKTVTTYRARLLEKMGLRSNAELTAYAFRHGLVP